MSLNPVLPPPRRRKEQPVRNPVDVLLHARSTAEVRRHFSRYRRARHYGWTKDTSYQGKMGGKWVGNAEHAGQVRYQQNEPGTGRQKKEPAGKGKKKPAPATEGHDDHDPADLLHRVLHGEGEQADELFAKLQDRIAAMSQEERREVAARLEKVLKGGKAKAAKKPAQEKSPPVKQPARSRKGAVPVADPAALAEKLRGILGDENSGQIADEVIRAATEAARSLTVPQFADWAEKVLGYRPAGTKAKMLEHVKNHADQMANTAGRMREIDRVTGRKDEPPRQPEPPKQEKPEEIPKRTVVQAGAKPTPAQVNFALSLLARKGFGTKWMNARFKELGASMRQRSGTVQDWLNSMNRGEISELIDRLKSM